MRCHAMAKTVVGVAPPTCEKRTERSLERACDRAKTRKVEVVTMRVTATVLLFAKRERDAPRRHLVAMTKIDTQRRPHDGTLLLLLQLMIDDLASASETGATLMTAAAGR